MVSRWLSTKADWLPNPTGERDQLLRVRHYDFNWQLVYEMGQPKLLPKCPMLRADATFDNSPNDRFNPDAKAEVRWGDQSWEEMMVGFFDVAIPLKADLAKVLGKRQAAPRVSWLAAPASQIRGRNRLGLFEGLPLAASEKRQCARFSRGSAAGDRHIEHGDPKLVRSPE
jgi:hypothetical protein